MSLQPQWKWGAAIFYLDLLFWGGDVKICLWLWTLSNSAQCIKARAGLGWAAQGAVYVQMSQSFKSLCLPAEILLDPPLTGDLWIGKGKEHQLNATRDRWGLLSLLYLFWGIVEVEVGKKKDEVCN